MSSIQNVSVPLGRVTQEVREQAKAIMVEGGAPPEAVEDYLNTTDEFFESIDSLTQDQRHNMLERCASGTIGLAQSIAENADNPGTVSALTSMISTMMTVVGYVSSQLPGADKDSKAEAKIDDDAVMVVLEKVPHVITAAEKVARATIMSQAEATVSQEAPASEPTIGMYL